MDILVVEDSATLRANMKSVLSKMGHRVHLAESGETCLHLIENQRGEQRYDLILMDVEMPGLNGFETTALVRETLPDHWIPIIFVTGVSDEESYAKGIEAGGDDYLAKPVSNVILKAKIRVMERIVEMQREVGRLYRELAEVSARDSLTQLLNRRAFNERSEQQWREAQQLNRPCAVIMVDVDHFKRFNDCYGHSAGDSCLKSVAKALRQHLPARYDCLARYGGEEFIAFLPETDQKAACLVAEKLRHGIEKLQINPDNPALASSVTASIGVALSHNPLLHQLNHLIDAADKQLYLAKNSGRNRVCCEELDSHKTILIGVDDPEDQAALSQMLVSLGNIVTADNHQECLEIARYIVPDLILMNEAIFRENSQPSAATLSDHRNTANIPIILIGASEPPDSDDVQDGSAVPRLQKPVDPGALHSLVQELFA